MEWREDSRGGDRSGRFAGKLAGEIGGDDLSGFSIDFPGMIARGSACELAEDTGKMLMKVGLRAGKCQVVCSQFNTSSSLGLCPGECLSLLEDSTGPC